VNECSSLLLLRHCVHGHAGAVVPRLGRREARRSLSASYLLEDEVFWQVAVQRTGCSLTAPTPKFCFRCSNRLAQRTARRMIGSSRSLYLRARLTAYIGC
jgi:hypothetical protein